MTRQAGGLDYKTFSRALRAYERTHRGWVDRDIGFPIEVYLNGVKQDGVIRAHRKRGVIEVTWRDSEGRLVVAGDDVETKFIHGKVKLSQFVGEPVE